MRGFHLKLFAVCLLSFLAIGSAFAAPTLSDAKVMPSTAWIGDHVVLTVVVNDPAKEVAKVDGVVVEYSEIRTPLNDEGTGDDKVAGDGIWSGGTDVPSEAFEGTYHIAIWPRNAAGDAFKVDDQFVRATVAITLDPNRKPAEPEAPKPAAAPTLSDAKITPDVAWLGDHIVISVAINDPAKQVAAVDGVVVEYSEIRTPLNDEGKGDDKVAGDGIWTAGTDVPSEAFEGTYHIAIWPKNAAGDAFKVDDQFLKATVAITLDPNRKPVESVATQPASAQAAGGPGLSDAKIEPANVKPGDRVVLSVAIADPGKAVAKVTAVVEEYPSMALPMNDSGQGDDKQAGDGVWTLGFEVPGEAPAGTYHFDMIPADAADKTFDVDGQPLKAVVELTIKSQEVTSTVSTDDLVAQAKPWRTETQIAKIKAINRKAGDSFRFLVMGDTRSNPPIFAKMLDMAAGMPKFDFSMNTGDIVPAGKPEEYAFFFTQIKDVTWPFLIVEGNHELGPTGGRLYEELFGPTDYFFDHGGIRFVGLNNSRGVVTPQQLEWLNQTLTTDLRKVVFFHAPPAVIKKWAFHAFSAGAEELADLLAKKKVERVYVGHIHGFGVAEYKGVTYVLTGGGGAGLYPQLAPGDFHNEVLVEVLPQGFRETVYKDDGSSFVLNLQKWISGQGQ
jgi:hypothetical protein